MVATDYFFAASDESSRIQGHAATVFTLPLLFLMIVIFMMGISG
jgi:hypothetical protein